MVMISVIATALAVVLSVFKCFSLLTHYMVHSAVVDKVAVSCSFYDAADRNL